ncbi:uncharacterized protein PG998_012994 [Apiospora kogelbergensis]|uniref:uncharacterized protein n=1 Tax=Apiospora kogelbergensis TaxID=1337665 RepID=UPI003131A70D
MDPISAFALACNILQIVDTSAKVLLKAAECYTDGATTETVQLSEDMHLLETLGTNLETVVAAWTTNQPSTAELRLREANERCLELSRKLGRLLDDLKVDKKSFRQAIIRSAKTVRYRGRISELREGVSDSRANLNLALLLLMHEKSSGNQDVSMRAHTDLENRIMTTFDQQSDLLSGEIQKLSRSIEGLSLEHLEDTMHDFRSKHETQLHQLSERVVDILEQQRTATASQEALANQNQSSAAQQRILQSLYFPQMEERKEQISEVYPGTYSWMFRDASSLNGNENFMSWLSAPSTERSVFWVSGKPGSGKSALMRFVDQKLNTGEGLLPWTGSTHVIKASHFLWKSGMPVQRSFDFLLRSLLYQILDQVPDTAASVVTPGRWRSAMSPERQPPEWAFSELAQALRSFVNQSACGLLILIDGLDELDNKNGRHENLVDFIQDLGSFDAVKICVSSRPDNIFRDAFKDCPQLRQQDLTTQDIQIFIRGQFAKQPRLMSMTSQGIHTPIKTLFEKIMKASSGVFLWVCLVVAELLGEARDGATVGELIGIVDRVPKDLEGYFSRIVDSIEAKYIAESSVMFQIALYEEECFSALHPLRLLDLSFLDERHSDFAIRPGYDLTKCDFSNTGVRMRLDSAFRRVNSRCRGLLEIKYSEGNTKYMLYERGEFNEDGITSELIRACDYHVHFLHRSFHDYLVEPRNMEWLKQRSNGAFDVRLFLCDARLVQLLSLDYRRREDQAQMAVGLASYIFTALSVDDLQGTKECAIMASHLQPVVESLMQLIPKWMPYGPWYLVRELRELNKDHDSFMDVAIGFGLLGYLKEYLTQDIVHTKTGRPLLCKALQQSAWRYDKGMASHNDVEVVRLVLDRGANPNEEWDGVSVWARFLELLLNDNPNPIRCHFCLKTVKLLLERSADPVLPASWFPRHSFASLGPESLDESDHRGMTTEPDTLPGASIGMVLVSHILENLPEEFTVYEAQELDGCIRLAKAKAALSFGPTVHQP